MGDVVSLVEKAAANIDAEKAARTAERMRKGQFDLSDMREQLLQMANMGGISGLMGMMPGIAKMKNQIANAGLDDKVLKRQVAVIDSMTRQERKNPDILKASRKKRIAAGAGLKVEEVNKLLKMHRNMADMMKAMGSGKRGPMAGIAQAMGFGGGMPSPEQMKALAEKMPGGQGRGGMPALPKDLPAGLRSGLPNLPGLTGLERQADPAGRSAASPDWGRSGHPIRHCDINVRHQTIEQFSTLNRRTKCQSLSASHAQAPRSARSITSSSPTRVFPATAASSSVSAISIRCCRRTTRRG